MPMNLEHYRQIVRSLANRRILVLGDLMLDECVLGRATRISPESPVMVVEVESERYVPGGAANMVNNLLALGARVGIIGVVGVIVAALDRVAGEWKSNGKRLRMPS